VIVVEGPDGAGKTTLIKALVEYWQLPIAPRVVQKDTTTTINIAHWVENNVRQGWQPLIFDRHRLISEPIYGPILRGHQDPHFTHLPWMRTQLGRFYESQPLVIYCLPPLWVVVNNCKNDETNDNSAVLEKIEAIYMAYTARAVLDLSLRPGTTWLYNYADHIHTEPPEPPANGRWDNLINARREW
jgi:ABC-type cobalamin/Fe3+-siderophores transport system ATPase subunit